MLSQPTTTTTKSPPSNRDRPIRRVSMWDRKHEGGGGFGFEYGMDGNDDPEYDGGFGNQLVRSTHLLSLLSSPSRFLLWFAILSNEIARTRSLTLTS